MIDLIHLRDLLDGVLIDDAGHWSPEAKSTFKTILAAIDAVYEFGYKEGVYNEKKGIKHR